MSNVMLCNFDDKPGMLCRKLECNHQYIRYIPMAAAFRCDHCRTFLRDDLKPETMQRFHDKHAVECVSSPAPETAKRRYR